MTKQIKELITTYAKENNLETKKSMGDIYIMTDGEATSIFIDKVRINSNRKDTFYLGSHSQDGEINFKFFTKNFNELVNTLNLLVKGEVKFYNY